MTSTEIVEEIKRVRLAAQQREIELIYKLRRHTPMGQIATLLGVDRKTLYTKLKKYESEQRGNTTSNRANMAG